MALFLNFDQKIKHVIDWIDETIPTLNGLEHKERSWDNVKFELSMGPDLIKLEASYKIPITVSQFIDTVPLIFKPHFYSTINSIKQCFAFDLCKVIQMLTDHQQAPCEDFSLSIFFGEGPFGGTSTFTDKKQGTPTVEVSMRRDFFVGERLESILKVIYLEFHKYPLRYSYREIIYLDKLLSLFLPSDLRLVVADYLSI